MKKSALALFVALGIYGAIGTHHSLRADPPSTATSSEFETMIRAKIAKAIAKISDPKKQEQILRLAQEIPETEKRVLFQLIQQAGGGTDPTQLDHVTNFFLESTTIRFNEEFQDWSILTADMDGRIADEMIRLSDSPTAATMLRNPDFLRAFERLAGNRFSVNNKVELLLDGSKAFEWRMGAIEDLLRKAKIEMSKPVHERTTLSLNILVWAIYDDAAGAVMADKLVDLAQNGVDIRLIVDGKTSRQSPYGVALLSLLEQKIEMLGDSVASKMTIVRWSDFESNSKLWASHLGNHSKVLVIDDGKPTKTCEVGGRNIGSEYFFNLDIVENESRSPLARWLSPEKLNQNQFYKEIAKQGDQFKKTRDHLDRTNKYSDASLVAQGDLCNDAYDLIQNMIHGKGLGFRSSMSKLARYTEAADHELRSLLSQENNPVSGLIDHRASRDDAGLMSHVLAISTAGPSDEIYIKNAYTVLNGPLRHALTAAVGRGAKVKFMTNDLSSIDEPTLGIPMMLSTHQLFRETFEKHPQKIQNLEIYLYDKNEAHAGGSNELDPNFFETIHDKWLVVTNKEKTAMITILGSQNLHPRSHWLDGETSIATLNRKISKTLISHFESEIGRLDLPNHVQKTFLTNHQPPLPKSWVGDSWMQKGLLLGIKEKVNLELFFISNVF